MKNVKKWRNTFELYDKYRLAEFFEKQAKEGWILEDSAGAYLFRRSEPRNLHYDIVYYPKATAFDMEPAEEQKILYDFCAHSGWELVTTNGFVQVFCNEQEHPVPIETDQRIELENIHKLHKSRFLYVCPILIVGLLEIILNIQSLLVWNQNQTKLITGIAQIVAWTLMILVQLLGRIFYRFWYGKAKQSVACGMGIPRVPSNRVLRGVEFIFTILAIFACALGSQVTSENVAISMTMIFFLLLLSMGLFRVLQGEAYRKFSSKSKVFAFILIIMVLAIVLGMITLYMSSL